GLELQVGGVQRRQLGETTADPAHERLVGVDGGVLHLLFELGVFLEKGGQPVVAHAFLPAKSLRKRERRPTPEDRGGRPRGSFFFFPGLALAYLAWNLATRPAVSSTRCLPV